MSVYGYIRLNTSVETPEGLGFKEQTQKINAWSADSKLEIKKIHRDKEPTSSSLDLPRLAKLTKQIDQGKVTVLVVVRLDRLTRSIRLYNHLLELLAVNNVRFVSLLEGIDTAKKSGKMVFNAMRIMGRWEAKAIPDRTREMIARKRKIGERVGHAPFGYIYQRRKLVPSDPEMQTVELIREKRLEEEMSYHRIAKLLNSRRILSKRGRRWYAETIKTVCENPLYGTPISQQKTISRSHK